MLALDLFCGAGGASAGLHDAGFEVVGVDIVPQPRYPYEFVQANAIDFISALIAGKLLQDLPGEPSLIWASPPCQAFTAYKRRKAHVRPKENLIPQVRSGLQFLGYPYVIENIPGAPLLNPFTLCGSMFGLDVKRHRQFETSFPVAPPSCRHEVWKPRFAPASNRKNLRRTVEVGVWRIPLHVQSHAMGIHWMQKSELSQAIPPAYSKFIALQLKGST